MKSRMRMSTWALTILAIIFSANGWSQSLESSIQSLVDRHAGYVAVAVEHLDTGERFTLHADEIMPTASLIKLPIMVAAYRLADQSQLNLDKFVDLRQEDRVPGSGILTQHFSDGLKLSLRDAIRLMIVFSDNTATNLVVEQMGLPQTTATMQELGFPETQLHSKVFRRDSSIAPERSKKYGLGSTTANDMIHLLKKIHQHQVASPTSCKAMMEHLLACDDKSCLVAKLPAGTKVAHKSGAVTGVRTDAGILQTPGGPIAVAVLTRDNQDESWSDNNAGNVLCADIAKSVYDYFNETPSKRNAIPVSPTVQLGASGSLVKALQRTLNRVVANSSLAVDGEFGPGTLAAVVRFQTERKLEANGIVGVETWNAIGPLQWEDEPVPPPDEVNSQVLKRKPAEDLDAPPVVTCKAWAITDAKTGKILWHQNGNDRLDIASTTKMMTALIVLQLAESEPSVLEETITFSKTADDTIGSTSDVRVGEQIQVKDLLYGLLLPSGNDASVAFAEHFGDRLPDGIDGQKKDTSRKPIDRFIEHMNRTAQALGLQSTQFANTSGLTHDKHWSTASDVASLAFHCMHIPQFQKIVATRQYGCMVTGPQGYQRPIRWLNTNNLLEIEGYTGIKTGTTDRAGACLAGHGSRGNSSLIVVVLGSASSPARYADIRNLFRWSWSKIEAPSQP